MLLQPAQGHIGIGRAALKKDTVIELHLGVMLAVGVAPVSYTHLYLCLASNRANRGYNSARNWNNNNATNSNSNVGDVYKRQP